MDVATTEYRIKLKSGDIAPIATLKLGDEIAIDDQGATFATVTAISPDMLVAENAQNEYTIPLSPAFKNILETLEADPQADASEQDADIEGDEGEATGADIIPFLYLAGQAIIAGAVVRTTVKTVAPLVTKINKDITDPNSLNITTSALQPGDILIKRMHSGDKTSGAIYLAQKALNNAYGYEDSDKLTHAMIYIGLIDGKPMVIEAVDNGVGVSPLRAKSTFNASDYNTYDFYVLRCRHSNVVNSAIAAAKELVFSLQQSKEGDRVRVTYDHKNLYLKIGEIAARNPLPNAVTQAWDRWQIFGDTTKQFKENLRTNNGPALFCSELAAYCYHTGADQAGKKRFFKDIPQDRLSPEQLYVFGRDDNTNFQYVGRLSAGAN